MVDVVKEFATPDRGSLQSGPVEEKKDGCTSEISAGEKPNPAATVTPLESATRGENTSKEEGRVSPLQIVASNLESPEDRKVRFGYTEKADSSGESPSSTGSQRGLVSRRGGRCASPGRIASNPNPNKEAVLEFKTYRSPPRKKETCDTVVSLGSDTSPDKVDGEVKEKGDQGCSSTSDTKGAGPISSRPESSRKAKSTEKKSNVSFSPVPPPRDSMRTPTKSPTGGRFQSLPVLDDDALRSPGSFFLSPQPPTPSSRMLRASGSFDTADLDKSKKPKDDEKQPSRQPMRSPKTPRSPRTPRRDDRERFLTTPTDFTLDYGRHPHSGSFDSSNVLAWLQSPTANGLFSPGGFGSMLNTPRGAPRTPRTPTAKVGPGSTYTPTINYKSMFTSPERARGLPMLEDSPLKGSKSRGIPRSASRDPSVDAVHMAERDLMEDEDLSVLLQLASNTPRPNGERPVAVSTSEGTHVFRSPQQRKDDQPGDENLPSLQLPIIGGRESGSNATRLSRKTNSRDHGEGTDPYHRPLGMRSTGSGSFQETSKSGKGESKKDEHRQDQQSESAAKPHKTTSMHPPHPAYSMLPHPYGHPDAPPYYASMPPGMQHGGSMRVVVGGPPPPRSKSSPPRSPRGRPYPIGPGDPSYPPYPPPPGHYAHHPGVPPHHMHPHYSHYAPPHHPPPRHMPMYGAQHPQGKSKAPKNPTNPPKPGAKRPLPSPPVKSGPAKKQKKASPPTAPKKKNRSPQLTDKVERQKAAATIQAVNEASGGKNDKAAALAAAILRGVTMRPSGKWQAQLYFAGKSRYIGVFDTREKAALAYEIAREKLKAEKQSADGSLTGKATEAAVNAARKAAFEGVNERDPRVPSVATS